jgi:hypothetical protein
MAALSLHRVSVWLDAFAPSRGAFAHALDWAAHLGLPLRAIAADCQVPAKSRLGADSVIECRGIEGEAADVVRACAATCDRSGIPLDTLTWRGPLTTGVQTLMDPGDLCVFGKTLPARLKRALLRESLQTPWASTLVCPTAWDAVSRILVLYQHADLAPAYLDAVATFCRRFDSRPVVLAMARTNSEARWRRRAAEGAFMLRGLAADFDTLVGGDVRAAVTWVAKWRRCTHVVLAKRYATGWWRWFRGDWIEQLLDPTDRLAFLALPDAGDAEDGPPARTAHSHSVR